MVSYLTGVAIAVGMIFGLHATLEMAAGKPVFGQDHLNSHSTSQLLKIAKDSKSEDQIEAILQLGARPGDLSVTFPVLAELTISQDEMVKNAATSSIGQIGSKSTPFVRPFLDKKNLEGYRIASSAIRAIGPAGKIYMPEIKMLLASEDAMYRRCGLFALQGLNQDAIPALDEIINCLLDEDFNNQCSACRIIEQLGPEANKSEKQLLVLLEKGIPSTRGWAAVCLGAIGPSPSGLDTAKLLSTKLNAFSAIEKQRVLVGLAKMGPEASHVEDDVRAMLQDHSKYVQGHAAFAIWRITGDSDESLRMFRKLLKDPAYVYDGLELVSMMGKSGLPLLDSLVDNLTSSDPGIREMAVVGIGTIGPEAKDAAGEVRKLLEDPDAMVRIAARQTLALLEPEKK